MGRRLAFLWLLAMGLAGCAASPKGIAMQGNADGVIIDYVGDVAATLPIAQQHCARYERVPVLHEAKENHAVYFCVRPGAARPAGVTS
ncbi:MAG TPA: hypothetical protein VMI30_05430 [Stellaceae bacterium]|nr:hypothetical protein [Stellaceae bacterium]